MEKIVRTAAYDFDLKPSPSNGGKKILAGRLAVFNDWTEIKSPVEKPYHFMERIAPGAFTKTIQENAMRLKVLFQHGKDASIGQKPLGRILRMEEVGDCVEYEVELLDAPYVNELVPGLEEGLYGSSFVADAVKSTPNWRPQRSSYNPTALPEFTHNELRMHEFGPVTFPAYGGATAKLRSQTEEFILPGLEDLIRLVRDAQAADPPALTEQEEPEPAPDGDEGEESTPDAVVSRHTVTPTTEERPPWFLE